MENLDEFNISKEALARLKDPTTIKKLIDDGRNFYEILGFSDGTMEKFYNAAYQLFERQHYEDAADAFIFLTVLNPRVHTYWLGLGMCEQLVGQCDAALVAYGMASIIKPSDPLPFYHSAACYHYLQDKENAIKSLELAIEVAGTSEDNSLIKNHALSSLAALNR